MVSTLVLHCARERSETVHSCWNKMDMESEVMGSNRLYPCVWARAIRGQYRRVVGEGNSSKKDGFFSWRARAWFFIEDRAISTIDKVMSFGGSVLTGDSRSTSWGGVGEGGHSSSSRSSSNEATTESQSSSSETTKSSFMTSSWSEVVDTVTEGGASLSLGPSSSSRLAEEQSSSPSSPPFFFSRCTLRFHSSKTGWYWRDSVCACSWKNLLRFGSSSFHRRATVRDRSKKEILPWLLRCLRGGFMRYAMLTWKATWALTIGTVWSVSSKMRLRSNWK